MKLVDKIENVGHYEVYGEFVLIGRDTRINNGIISSGNQILKKSEGDLEILREGEYFYFTGFKNGILYYEKEGKPIYFSNKNENLQLTPERHYFNPLHNLSTKDEVIITEMDKEFNQKHFFLNSFEFSNRKECEVYPQLNNEKYYCRFHKKESWIEIVTKQTENSYRKIDVRINEVEMDKREKPLLDSNKLFIPLSGGNVTMFNCSSDSIEWVNQEFDEQYVSYNSNTNYLYQHFGRGVNQISKSTGNTTNSISFADSLNEIFHSSGKIWCTDDYVITKDLISGKFCILRANDLEPIGLEFIMKQGFADSPRTFQILGDRIFVLGMDNILKEYKMNWITAQNKWYEIRLATAASAPYHRTVSHNKKMNPLSVIEFYNNLEEEFPEIKSMELLKGIDIANEGWENSNIMVNLAEQVAIFAKNKYLDKTKRFMGMVEDAFMEGDNTLQSYLYTDFLVTISEQISTYREPIKSIFGARTMENYKKLLALYNENSK